MMPLNRLQIKALYILLLLLPLIIRSQATGRTELRLQNGNITLPGTFSYPVVKAENLKLARPTAELHIIPNMDHVLKEVNSLEENQKSYYRENFPISGTVAQHLKNFIKKIDG